MVFRCGSKCKWRGVRRNPRCGTFETNVLKVDCSIQEWVTDGRTTCLLYYDVSVFKLTETKKINPHRVRASSFLQYQILWIDQNDKRIFFFNVCSCVLQITYHLRICSTNSKSWVIPQSVKQKRNKKKYRNGTNCSVVKILDYNWVMSIWNIIIVPYINKYIYIYNLYIWQDVF